MLRFLAVCLFVIEIYGESKEDYRIVGLKGLGGVKGVKFWDGEFHEFYGVPYALAPNGTDRYKAPLPLTPWNKVMKANRGPLQCHQVHYSEDPKKIDDEYLAGSMDCLIAHLMVPKVANEKNLVPVMVYIHSGAFAGGSAFMAKYHKTAQQDIIVVALNYRLGALGFACLGTENVPGNAALKDLVAGLKWINKHIRSFGGDNKKVTIAGYSAGAVLAELLSLTDEAQGLFHRVMLDSGSALMPFAVDRDPINTARNIAKAAGFEDSGTINDLEEFLLKSDLKALQAYSRNFFMKNSTFGFAPCVENPKLKGGLLTKSPYDILKRGNLNFDVLTGFSNMEGISRTSKFEDWKDLMSDNIADFFPADLKFSNDKEKTDFAQEVKQKYFEGKAVSLETLQGYVDYFSDVMFKYGQMRSAKLHAARRPIYLYEFTYVGKLNTKHYYMDRIFGSSHRDASNYVLDFYDWTRNYTDMDHRDRMVTMWTDYVKYGNPTSYESDLIKINWQKYTNENPSYLEIGYELVNKNNLLENSYKFWDRVYQKHFWNPTAPDPKSYKPTVAKSDKPAIKTETVVPSTDDLKKDTSPSEEQTASKIIPTSSSEEKTPLKIDAVSSSKEKTAAKVSASPEEEPSLKVVSAPFEEKNVPKVAAPSSNDKAPPKTKESTEKKKENQTPPEVESIQVVDPKW